MRIIFSRKVLMAGMISSLFLLSSITVLEESKVETGSRIENLSYSEKIQVLRQLEEIKQLLENMLDDDAMRASRPDAPTYGDQTYPVPPSSSSINSVLLEQIRCIVCLIKKYLGSIDHTAYWESLIDAIECSNVDESVPSDVSGAIDMLARALTEVLVRIGCVEDCTLLTFPSDVLGRLCYIKLLLDTMDSKLDNLTVSCDLSTIESKIDRIESKIGEPWDTLDFDLLPSNTQETNDATYSVIEWLKAIYYHLYNEV